MWDLDTRAMVRLLDGHAKKKAVTCVDWSRNSRYLLSAGKDWNIVIWDLSAKTEPLDRHATIRFDQPVSYAAFHPRNSKIILAVLASGEAFIVDRRAERSRTELIESVDENENDQDAPRRHGVRACTNDDGSDIYSGLP